MSDDPRHDVARSRPAESPPPRHRLAACRDELIAAARAILSQSETLLSAAANLHVEGLLDDVKKIRLAGQRLVQIATEELWKISPPDEEVHASESRLRHELGNSLNHILGYCEMVLEETADGVPKSFAAGVRETHQHGKRMRLLIDEVVRASGKLPRRRVTDDAVNSPRGAGGPDEKPEAGTILVVEDNEANRELLTRRLTRQGHLVVAAENGREALEQITARKFDLVLLDIIMPEVDGFQVLKHLKTDEPLRDIPVIMISALDDMDGVVRCIEMGAEDYLTKPFDPVLLRARIGACLEKKRLRDREKMHLSQIEQERRRASELLHVILPDEIIEELKATNRVEPRRYDEVAVLFADLVGFTDYCDTHRPEEVVADLQRLIEAWEEIALRHGIEKIKTIGDALMAASGLLKPADNPVQSCIECGQDLIEVVGRITPHWSLRVGIHLGPVVAGVLGRRQYLFDLWGDTVNTASRIEGLAAPGSITLSGAAWQRVASLGVGEPLGSVEVRGKGPLELVRFQHWKE